MNSPSFWVEPLVLLCSDRAIGMKIVGLVDGVGPHDQAGIQKAAQRTFLSHGQGLQPLCKVAIISTNKYCSDTSNPNHQTILPRELAKQMSKNSLQ